MKGARVKTLISVMWGGGGKIVQSVLQLVVLGVLARFIKPSDFGVINAALIVVSFTTVFSQLGIAPALVQRNNLTSKHISTAYFFTLLLGSLLGIIIYANAEYLAKVFAIEEVSQILKYLVILFPIIGLSNVANALFERKLKYKWISIRNIVSYSVGYGIVAIVFGVLGYGVYSIVAGHIVYELLRLLFFVVFIRPKIGDVSFKALVDLLVFGGGYSLARAANYIANNADQVITARVLGAEGLGLYGRAYQIIIAPVTLVSSILDKVLYSVMSRMQDERDRVVRGFLAGTSIVIYILGPISIAAILMSEEIILLILGVDWREAIQPFTILGVGILFRACYKLCDSVSISKGYVYSRALIQGLVAIVTVISCYFGAHHFGINGVAMAITLSYVLNFMMMLSLSLSILKLDFIKYIKNMTRPVVFTLVSGLVIFLSLSVLRNYFSQVIIVIGVMSIYTVFVFVLNYFVGDKIFSSVLRSIVYDTLRILGVR
ncbi:MAG: O83 family O-antigen flippase [Parasphingorhabdus sp.]